MLFVGVECVESLVPYGTLFTDFVLFFLARGVLLVNLIFNSTSKTNLM